MRESPPSTTDPGTDDAVWRFSGKPPEIEGGELAPDDHQPSARYVAEADDSFDGAACYEVTSQVGQTCAPVHLS